MKSPFLCLLIVLLLCPLWLFGQAWEARHGLSPTQYQTEFNSWTSKGYRLSLVSGYTDNGQEKYIGVWEKKSGPEYKSHHAMTGAQYQTAFDNYTKLGFRPINISAFALGNAPRFAAIWEKKDGPAWAARHNLTATQYQKAVDDFKAQGFRPRQVCGYVVGGVEMFAALWDKSSAVWEARHNLTAAQYQQVFNDLNAKGYKPVCVTGYTKNNVELFAAVFEKKATGPWEARHSIAAVNYQPTFDNMLYAGYRPVWLQGYANGSSSRFNGVWDSNTMTGADRKKIDDAVNGYMSSQSVKGLSLAVCKNGKLVFAKAYGYADPAKGIVLSPNNPLRIMSISKPVTAVGVMMLLQQGKLTSLNRKVFGSNSILGSQFTTPNNLAKLNGITVRQLLWHISGLRTCNGEPEFWNKDKTAAQTMNALLGYSDLMKYDTNKAYEYSNTGFFVLGRIIETLSGESYEGYIRKNVLTPAGIGSAMYVGNADGSIRAGEGNYTPMTNMNLQLWGPFGGWVARPIDLLKLLNKVDGVTPPSDILTAANHTTMTTGSGLNGGYGLGWLLSADLQGHNGCHGSSRSFLMELPNGLSYAVIINSTPTNDGCGWTMKSAIEAGITAVAAWPSYDLF